jgi:hypothetical protein
MPAQNLDDAINKLADSGVQDRVRLAIRTAAFEALAKEGIVLTPNEWGELIARLAAARDAPEQAQINFGTLLGNAAVVLPTLASLF